tara:strand:+ start:830 stop:1006 length:177 start_codon:yes stop_codon:yes gene_type:complete
MKIVTEVQSFFQFLDGTTNLINPVKKSRLLQKIIFKDKQKKEATPIKGFINSDIYKKD